MIQEKPEINLWESIDKYVSLQKNIWKNTRGGDFQVELEPICYYEDTVMILANYNEGWDLFAYDYRTPMRLMNSQIGHLHSSDLDSCGSIQALIEDLAEGIAAIKRDNPIAPIDNSWFPIFLDTITNVRRRL